MTEATTRAGGGPEGPQAPGAAFWLLFAIATILIVTALRQTAWITSTFAMAFFAALAIWPVDTWISRHMPRPLAWIGHAAALAVMVSVFALFSLGILFAARQLATGLARYQTALQQFADRIGQWMAVAEEQGGGDTPVVERLIDPLMSLATTVVQSIWSSGGILTLLFFLVLLMLVETPSFMAKVSAATSQTEGRTLYHVVEATASRFRRYLVVRTVLGVATALLYMSWIWWWGLDFVLVWGLLAFLLNFIPTIGSLIAGALPVGLAFLQRDPATALIIAAGLIVIEQVMGNYVDPRLQGRQLSLSPLVVLVALMFWTWVWGLLGALLAVPMTMAITIAFARVKTLQPIALFLSNAKNLDELRAVTD
ncbi:AI-2E family transporter [Nitratireductor sp. GCM10026969]|uniref:AI-2E family transporter n=1 Tax=Nitratireductor sp. GCM10026969 TaxID=3252645 RepID=UPI0036216F64